MWVCIVPVEPENEKKLYAAVLKKSDEIKNLGLIVDYHVGAYVGFHIPHDSKHTKLSRQKQEEMLRLCGVGVLKEAKVQGSVEVKRETFDV